MGKLNSHLYWET